MQKKATKSQIHLGTRTGTSAQVRVRTLVAFVLFAVLSLGHAEPARGDADDYIGDLEYSPTPDNQSNSPQNEPDTPEESGTLAEAEFAPSWSELREPFEGMAAVGFGFWVPWTTHSFEGRILGENDYILAVSSGEFTFDGNSNLRAYEATHRSSNIYIGMQTSMSRFENLFFNSILGYHSHSGEVETFGIGNAPTASDKLTSSFTISSVSLNVATGLQYVWSNGIAIDWSIFGVTYPWLVEKKLGRDSTIDNNVVSEVLIKPGLFGIINFKIGYCF